MENYILILLCLASFLAGFIDAIAGGGGLIQTPIAMILLPFEPISNLIGTLKIPGITGTSLASFQYLKKVKIDWKFLGIMSIFSCVSAFFGSWLVTIISNTFMKPMLFFVLIIVAIYTFLKKDLGAIKVDKSHKSGLFVKSIVFSALIGFYDGFIGPGTGSFLLLGLISILGFDFLHASANAKLINVASNIGSLVLFISKGKILWMFALPMAVCNGVGGWLGSKTAIKKGNNFIRIFFLIVVIGTLIRLSFDVF